MAKKKKIQDPKDKANVNKMLKHIEAFSEDDGGLFSLVYVHETPEGGTAPVWQWVAKYEGESFSITVRGKNPRLALRQAYNWIYDFYQDETEEDNGD